MTNNTSARPAVEATASSTDVRDTHRRWARPFVALLASAAVSLLIAFPSAPAPARVDSNGFSPTHAIDADSHNWGVSEASWYGPGFYGRRTACGQTMTSDLVGVAHKSLPCGTLVRFEWHGTEVVAPVVDRGPYVHDREWDLTHGTCARLGRCHTAAIAWTL